MAGRRIVYGFACPLKFTRGGPILTINSHEAIGLLKDSPCLRNFVVEVFVSPAPPHTSSKCRFIALLHKSLRHFGVRLYLMSLLSEVFGTCLFYGVAKDHYL